MRKSTIFLSVVLTTFMLAILVAGASAYQNLQQVKETAAQPAKVAAENVSVALPADAPAPAFTPEQAAALAAKVIGRTDLYSVETADLNGVSAYMVTFSSGDIVYVSPDGQILSITKTEPQVVVAAAPAFFGGGGGGGGGGSSSNQPSVQPPSHEQEHESEHPEEPEHDD